MRTSEQAQSFLSFPFSALWSLTVNENNAQLVTEEKGISDVVSALKAHGTKPDGENTKKSALSLNRQI